MTIKTVDQAIVAKLLWKPGIIRDYCASLLIAAIELRRTGVNWFNNDDVPEQAQPCDKTTVGAAVRMLLGAGLITGYIGHHPDRGVHQGRRKSTRAECRGHSNPLYYLSSIPLATEWLHRNGYALAHRGQLQLFPNFEPQMAQMTQMGARA